MAAIRRKHGHVAVACCDSLLFCNIGDYCGWQSLTISPVKKKKEEEGEEEEEEKPSENAGNRLLAFAFSTTGRYLAACDDQKQLHVYETGQTWSKLSTRPVVRRGKSLVFTQNDEKLLLADKCGDVYIFSVLEPDSPGELTLGHLSMVLDVALVKDDRYVITCDRDEKIRISNFPNSYNIHSFCLGHTDFVSSLCYDSENNILISGSGDLTVRSWNLEGQEQGCIRTNVQVPTDPPADTETRPGFPSNLDSKPAVQTLTYCAKHRLLAVGFYGYPNIEIYQLKKDGSLSPTETLPLSSDPWDLHLDDSGILWVLQPVEGRTLQLYKVQLQGHSYRLTEVIDDEKLVGIKDDLNSMWQDFKGCLEIKSIVPTLWKQRIDNMSEYLKKKEERLSGNKSGGDNPKDDNQPPEKILKLTS